MTTPAKQRTLLVTGASGHLGRRAVELLLAAKTSDRIIAASRSPEKIVDLKAAGAETRALDFERPETLATAFAGVDRVLLVSTDAVDQPGRRFVQHRAAIAAAKAAGVKHIVYTSVPNASLESAMYVAADHFQTEQALALSGLGYTALRNSLYMENNLPAFKHALESGQWFAAAGEGRVAYVTREDCAAVAAGALAALFDGQRTLDVTGPDLLTHAQVAKLVAEITGRPFVYVPAPVDAIRAGMKSAGLPDFVVELLVTFDIAIAKGELDIATDVVETLGGRKPTTLRAFLAANRAALV